MGHNKEIDISDDLRKWMKRKSMIFFKERLQVKIVAKAGWWLGSHDRCINPRDLEESLMSMEECKGIPIECRVEMIRIEKGKKTETKALWAMTSWEKVSYLRAALKKIYSKTKKQGYPLGKYMRFIPNILDTRFITTTETKQKVRKAVGKQKKFLASVETAISYSIIGLDYLQPQIKMTLREIVMGMRSFQSPDKNLFINVDEQHNSHIVNFVFHQDRTEEAMMVIPALPIVLQAKFGARVWDWFNEEAKIQAEDYFWDTKKGLQSKEDEALALQLEEWDGEWDNEEDEDEDEGLTRVDFEQFKIVTDQPGKNQFYDDSKPVASFGTEKVRDDDSETDQDMTSPTSTLTTETNWQSGFEEKMKNDAEFRKYVQSKYLSTEADGTSSPPEAKQTAETSGTGE
jgi:hypothetical protein